MYSYSHMLTDKPILMEMNGFYICSATNATQGRIVNLISTSSDGSPEGLLTI